MKSPFIVNCFSGKMPLKQTLQKMINEKSVFAYDIKETYPEMSEDGHVQSFADEEQEKKVIIVCFRLFRR